MEIRRAKAHEAHQLRELRLSALRSDPYAFGSSYNEEASKPGKFWDSMAILSDTGDTNATFVAIDNHEWLGMIGGYTAPPRAAVGAWGMWVAPHARRRGTSHALISALLDWATAVGATQIELSVTDQATTAAALYTKLGFRPTGQTRPLASDPSITEHLLELKLDT